MGHKAPPQTTSACPYHLTISSHTASISRAPLLNKMHQHYCAKVAAGCGKHRGRDGSRYGRYHRLPYSALHIARISVAAVQSNARCMLDEARIRMLGPIGPPPGLAA